MGELTEVRKSINNPFAARARDATTDLSVETGAARTGANRRETDS